METINVGDIINVDVCQPNFGKYPIGRYNGIICKLRLPEDIKFLEYGCTVSAVVCIKEPKFLIVLVDEVIKSAASNHVEADKAIQRLKELNKKPDKHVKVKKNYPYLRANEH